MPGTISSQRRRVRSPKAGWPIVTSACLALLLPVCRSQAQNTEPPISVPVNQVLSPAGTQVYLPGMRPLVIALSPDGHLLVTSGKSDQLVVMDPATGTIADSIKLPPNRLPGAEKARESEVILDAEKGGQASFTGLTFSPDGRHVVLSDVKGFLNVFSVDAHHKVTPQPSIPLPPSDAKTGQKYDAAKDSSIPTGLAFSPDGHRLYVALNFTNQLLELEFPSGKVLRQFEVGVAPFDVSIIGAKAYVSNWGGRRPDPDSLSGAAGLGSTVRVDPVRYIASEGSVSVIDLNSGSVGNIPAGLHASALCLSPDKHYLFVANASSDTISVIDPARDAVVETISLRWEPNDFFGASPNALAMDPQGKTLYVCNGTQNALAVVSFSPGHSKLQGLIPTGWYPGAVVFDPARKLLDVANIKGKGSGYVEAGKKGFNSKQYLGSISLIPVPSAKTLATQTATALKNYGYAVAAQAKLPPRPDQAAQPVPERPGEPSPIHHIIYIIKENRTYDQVLGDLKQGQGDASLCMFGETITPNYHKLVQDFVLLDNTHCSGILSADGHQWSDSAFSTDYMEREFAGFPRSYPAAGGDSSWDALAYSPTGFIWDNALSHHCTLAVFGEFTTSLAGWKDPAQKKKPGFLDFYQDFTRHTGLMKVACRTGIPSLKPYSVTDTVGFDLLVPDVWRAQRFVQALHEYEARDAMPNLIILWLPNDHTSGAKEGAPTPAAHNADNDLAFGQIVEAVSHSKFWKDTCIFSIEDDPQNGWDHLSAYRTTAYLISPYVRRHAVVSENYTTSSLLRTMELILGLPPMNLFDATATPMTACFTDQPNFDPYAAVPNNIPLDQLNVKAADLTDPILRKDAIVSSKLPLNEADKCPEDVLNHILWHASKGSHAPYPDWASLPPAQRKDADD